MKKAKKYVGNSFVLKRSLQISFLGLLLLSTTPLLASGPRISVEIVSSSAGVSIRSSGLSFYNISPGKSGSEHLELPTATVTSYDDGIRLNGRRTGWRKAGVVADNEMVWVNGKAYKGSLLIKQNGGGRLSVINVLPMEDYLEGILPGEMPSSWPIEALKAQAVVARTYALFVSREERGASSDRSFDLTSTVEDQVYDGNRHLNPKIAAAVKGTRGEIVTYRGSPIKARFHSSCGGRTETSKHVWGEADASKSIIDPYCKKSPYNRWTVRLTAKEMGSKLSGQGFETGNIKDLSIERYKNGGRVAAVLIEGDKQTISLTGNDFRRYIGFNKIKSTNFNVKKYGSSFVFSGKGFGHGVGMCQWGARGMAEMGMSYKEILSFYYPGTKIGRAY